MKPAIITLILLCSIGFCEPLIQTEITYKGQQVTIYCYGTTPGSARGNPLIFTSFEKQIQKLKSRLNNSRRPLAEAEKERLKRTLKRLKAYKKLGETACSNIGNGNFDLDGNVTPVGKERFGIPQHLSANISEGRRVYLNYCTCHGERTNYTFPVLRDRIKRPPMFFDEQQISDQALAHLTAYFNRFR
jgi:hypothetical protein